MMVGLDISGSLLRQRSKLIRLNGQVRMLIHPMTTESSKQENSADFVGLSDGLPIAKTLTGLKGFDSRYGG
jgi:hypothetical protein